ncbi:CDP-alcohol phosphatidyltransferase family protein [bacterium]|nr:CDP-alcohol phosphatidyltransferase family protein [bacterium]
MERKKELFKTIRKLTPAECLRQLTAAPNLISISRLLLLPALVHYLYKDKVITSALILVIIWVTDYVDGLVARRFRMKTDLGLILDPVADKITTTVLLIALYYMRGFPLWIAMVMIGRDVVIITAGYYLLNHERLMQSDILGKMTTVLVSIIVFFYMIHWEETGRALSFLLPFFIVATLTSYGLKFFEIMKHNTGTHS